MYDAFDDDESTISAPPLSFAVLRILREESGCKGHGYRNCEECFTALGSHFGLYKEA
ncbi:MAG: hypothetical protein GY854_06470 [Deltaproteobacteria bacterium]|nr:hypothetical protein [Deltaproteobacteria bacterium]